MEVAWLSKRRNLKLENPGMIHWKEFFHHPSASSYRYKPQGVSVKTVGKWRCLNKMGNQQVNFFTYQSAVDGHNYDYNPDYNQSSLFADYTLFYTGIGICAAIAIFLIFFNLILACCSPWRKYWLSRFTGNRYTFQLFILAHSAFIFHFWRIFRVQFSLFSKAISSFWAFAAIQLFQLFYSGF